MYIRKTSFITLCDIRVPQKILNHYKRTLDVYDAHAEKHKQNNHTFKYWSNKQLKDNKDCCISDAAV